MIYISLTTVPLRMSEWNLSKQNLESLVNQKTDKEYKVVLNIPYYYKNNNNEEYKISEELLKFAEKNPRLIINRVEEDFGPIIKIVGCFNIANQPDDIIIACDDDHVYHEDMIEYHLKKRAQYPKAAIAFRGDVPIEKREWQEGDITKFTIRPTHLFFPVKNDLQLLIPGHWHSVGYLRSFFKEDFTTKEFISLSDNDDILVGYYFKKNQIDIRCVKWDEETDWRAVNEYGRPAWSFPIKYALPFANSGFYEFRQIAGDEYGRASQEVTNLLHNHDIIYTEL